MKINPFDLPQHVRDSRAMCGRPVLIINKKIVASLAGTTRVEVSQMNVCVLGSLGERTCQYNARVPVGWKMSAPRRHCFHIYAQIL